MTLKDTRKQHILDCAMHEAHRAGYSHVTRDAIAARAECATGLVSHYFGTMVELKRAIMSEAIRTRALRIVAQGIADGHPKARRVSEELRREAIDSLRG